MEVKPYSVKPETMQMLGRLNAHLFIDIQEERKQPAPQLPIVDTVPREEFESLKTLLYVFKAELDDLRKDNNLLRQEFQSLSLRYE
jgi:BMFP domain-containing protein YqiC